MAKYKNGDTASWDAEQVRRGEQVQKRRQVTPKQRKKRKRINPLLYILFVLVTSAILASVGWLLISDLCAFNKDYVETTVEVNADDNVRSVAEKLENAGLIEYKWFFRMFASVAKADEKIGMGTYTLSTEMDYRALIRNMHDYEADLIKEEGWISVTIPEGMMVHEILALMAEKGVATYEELEDACANMEKNTAKVTALRDKLIAGLSKIPHSALNGDPVNRLPGNVSFCFEGIEGESLLLMLDMKGISASSGSACTSGSLDPSHVLLAIGRVHDVAHGSLRLSLSHYNTEEEVDYILEAVPEVVQALRNMSPVWRDLQTGKREYIL